MKITKTSVYTNRKNTMDIPITQEEHECWKKGGDIDVCIPHLSYDEREFMLTGATPEELDEMYDDDNVDTRTSNDIDWDW